jgi:hypothetical protein
MIGGKANRFLKIIVTVILHAKDRTHFFAKATIHTFRLIHVGIPESFFVNEEPDGLMATSIPAGITATTF